MCIYCGTNKYRKIYENHYGNIPRDREGRSYEIHHIDGNHSNNDPTNLTALTLTEHYEIHFKQGDYFACMLMQAQRMNSTPAERSAVSKLNALSQLKNGTHVSQIPGGMDNLRQSTLNRIKDGTHLFLNSDFHRDNNAKRVAAGTHHFLDPKFRKHINDTNKNRLNDGTHLFKNPIWQAEKAKKTVESGKHNFLGGDLQRNRVKNGTHPSQIQWTCIHCNVSGKGKGNFTRYHGNNCAKS